MGFPSRAEYERLVYGLADNPGVARSTLRLLQPEISELSSTFPHHYHEPPDIKHNRKPAPGISFTEPNLPTLIADCLVLGTGISE